MTRVGVITKANAIVGVAGITMKRPSSLMPTASTPDSSRTFRIKPNFPWVNERNGEKEDEDT